jgi:hypothetical protein
MSERYFPSGVSCRIRNEDTVAKLGRDLKECETADTFVRERYCLNNLQFASC